ncbi:PTS sugar transporter subunit IIA [Sediminibacillus terrae]|uniref:PTS sugar transporter subunit IIA n=1 Tax=Sediminibacillus terrae TaxID=1562106 RepID=UPI0004168B04|nr:PTS sugar transporter subunit IIA [Sediminibacillus terrae]
MIGMVLTGHGTFPEGLLDSVQLIAGIQENVKAVSFKEDKGALESQLREAIASVEQGDGVICFADLAGGTPFNVSSLIANEKDNVRVVGGTNVPMVLSGVFQREKSLDEFVSFVLSEGAGNVKKFEKKRNKEASSSTGI